jgi:hypothetical protein
VGSENRVDAPRAGPTAAVMDETEDTAGPPRGPAAQGAAGVKSAAREAQLAAALRANLRRRKRRPGPAAATPLALRPDED